MQEISQSAPLVPPDSLRSWLDALAQPVAITGGTGFVGSHLVDCLCAAGMQPRVLIRDPESVRWIGSQPIVTVPGSLHDRQALHRLVDGAGTVLHLAGVVRAGRAAELDRGNRIGTVNLVAALREAAPETRLVHVSSLAAAGPSPAPEGIGPEAEPHPISAYGRSKLAGEQAVRELEGAWTILRPPAIYGPRDTDVLDAFRMAAKGWLLRPAGSRSLTIAYVADVVRAILAATVAAPGRCFHTGEPRPYQFQELLQLIAETGKVRARSLPVPGLLIRAAGAGGSLLHLLGMRRLTLTWDKTREILARHWTARTEDSLAALAIGEQTDFKTGSAVTWAWYRSHGWL
jgi:nucleoside-diphosphate-sugar epimerase